MLVCCIEVIRTLICIYISDQDAALAYGGDEGASMSYGSVTSSTGDTETGVKDDSWLHCFLALHW